MVRISSYSCFFLILFFLPSCAQNKNDVRFSDAIRLNQVGFYPDAEKIAIVSGRDLKTFFIATPDLKDRVYEGTLSSPRKSLFSDKQTQLADFSKFNQTGSFVLVVPGLGYSWPFDIKPGVFDEVAKGSLKGFYYQRFSTSLPEQYAGKWNRPFSHPDNKVLIHPSAVSVNRPAGTVISSPKGWIDAGDYNKYIVNSGITMGTMLSAYEDFPDYYDALKINIPESSNNLPDLLDETLWNLRWMLTMQDPDDGGVYHKCTNANFDPMIMPQDATAPRYVVKKSTAAALDFAAVTAEASRVLKKFETQLPGLSDSCLRASQRAWNWAVANPNIAYEQDQMNTKFDPDVTTGAYGDRDFKDEFIWAAAELAITTNASPYIDYLNKNLKPEEEVQVPSWAQVKLLSYYSLLRFEKSLPTSLSTQVSEIKNKLTAHANQLIAKSNSTGYATVMGSDAKDFPWGSNSVAANQGIELIQIYRLTGEQQYLNKALGNLDYLLGRNATGYSYLTGFGDKPPMHIHHRPSEADGIADPVPGLLAGGPNPGMQDKCSYPSSIPDEAYVDDVCSYASNEIAINWNAPFVYLAGAIEAIHQKNKP
jgi:endoglucanase